MRLVTLVEECQLKWYGHVRRIGEERKAKQGFKIQVQERFGYGRPHIIWKDRTEKL